MKLKVKEINGKYYVQRVIYRQWKNIKCFDSEEEANRIKSELLSNHELNLTRRG